ncbi:MAG TPA: hypothetical protein VE974_02880 [Thermoanaerobaculia bacterium]|nr:hypothetical protein [Thermoanaerobaculia bacterium]
MASGLTRPEIFSVVSGYIGVDGGYLCDFTYSSHAEFYPYYCDLDINPLELEGMTTRNRFIKILDDEYDARWLAHMMRLGILPKGYIYPREQRAVRDLLRKRATLVRQRTANI